MKKLKYNISDKSIALDDNAELFETDLNIYPHLSIQLN